MRRANDRILERGRREPATRGMGTTLTTVFIDDQDEFADHSVTMNYPERLIGDIQAAADELYRAVKAQQAPFDGTDVEWFTEGRK